MTKKPSISVAAFSRAELMIVVAILGLVFSFFALLPLGRAHFQMKIMRGHASCIFALRELGVNDSMWANDHNNHFPASTPILEGGWSDFLTNADQGSNCWKNYAILFAQFGRGSQFVVCPMDERWDFATDIYTNHPPDKADRTRFKELTDNRALSYFVGVNASLSEPRSVLGGDRNLGPGSQADANYGYSPKNGVGNDVVISTNSLANPVSWSVKMHSEGSKEGAGNILLADASVQQVTSQGFRQNVQPRGGVTTNWPLGHASSQTSFRLIFP